MSRDSELQRGLAMGRKALEAIRAGKVTWTVTDLVKNPPAGREEEANQLPASFKALHYIGRGDGFLIQAINTDDKQFFAAASHPEWACVFMNDHDKEICEKAEQQMKDASHAS